MKNLAKGSLKVEIVIKKQKQSSQLIIADMNKRVKMESVGKSILRM